MKNWLTSRVGALLDVQNGFAFKSELFNDSGKGLPIIRIRDLSRGYSETFYDGEHDPSFEVFDNDLLIGMDGEFRCYRWHGGKALLNQRVCRLQKFNKSLHPQFLFYGINDYLREIEANTAFVTVKHLSSKQIANLEIPLPPLPEQARIVKLLDEADALRKLRAQADTRTAALIPALFDEMFGDPERNPKKWTRKSLADVLETIDSGWSPPCQERTAQPDEWGVLKLSAVTKCKYDDTENKALPETLEPRPELEVNVNDILFTRKNTFALVGACAMVFDTRAKLMLSDLVFRLKIKKGSEILPIYLWALLTIPSKRKQVQSLASGSAGSMPNISKGRLLTLSVELPPLPLQKEFAARVTELRALETAQTQSRARLEELFQSMLHKAFRGEL